MNCTKPIYITVKSAPEPILVGCGKCLLCRIQKRQEWALRLTHELSYYEKSCFITLTYSPENIPENNSLRKTDLQKFFKRLRKNMGIDRKIKYFACGEYGDQTERPHYHSIIFGLSINPEDKQLISASWNKGLIHFGLAEKDSIRYVAQYIDKKYSGDEAEQQYTNKNREAVFKLSSLGLGLNYCLDNRKQIETNKKVTLWGVPHSIPRYYLKKLGLDTETLKEFSVEKTCEVNEKILGLNISDSDAYHALNRTDYKVIEDGQRQMRSQKERTLKAKINLRNKKL